MAASRAPFSLRPCLCTRFTAPTALALPGKLEHFEDDWQRLEALLATRPHAPRLPPRPRTPHRNPTPGELSALLREALGNRTALLKQVCAFYTQDYMCFGYKSPPGCEPPPKMAKK